MKRCSQCDFVYEDDQARCDMDGGELVYEPTLYPAAETAIAVIPPPMKFRSRSFIFTAAATVIMGSFLGIGLFGFPDRSQSPTLTAPAAKPASAQPPAIVQPAMAATSSKTTASSEAASSPHNSTETPAANIKSRNVTSSASASAAKPAPTASRPPSSSEVRKTEPTKTPQKEESKVGSLLKKTGRILKKPFRKW